MKTVDILPPRVHTRETEEEIQMNLMPEELARLQMSDRLGEAQARSRGHHLALARRMSRRAEKAALQARLALARAI